MLAGRRDALQNSQNTRFLARGFTLRGKSEELVNQAKASSNTICVAYSDVAPEQ